MPFETLIPDTHSFMAELAANNSRDWFLENKARFEETLKAPATILMDVVAADLQKISGAPVTAKLFRPHRDVRFSKDKTPYHTHLHMMWTSEKAGAYFFGIDLDKVVVGGGAMGFDKDRLTAFRTRLDGPKGADLARILSELQAQGFASSEPELKRVPSPFGADHTHAELLRRKSLSMWRPVDEATPNLRNTLKGGFAALLPLQDWLSKLR